MLFAVIVASAPVPSQYPPGKVLAEFEDWNLARLWRDFMARADAFPGCTLEVAERRGRQLPKRTAA